MTFSVEQVIAIIGAAALCLTGCIGKLFQVLMQSQEDRIERVEEENKFLKDQYEKLQKSQADKTASIADSVNSTKEIVSTILQIVRLGVERERKS